MNISFEKAALHHKETIFTWLSEPFVQEFWDNSQEHKDDIINFMMGRKVPSAYCNGQFVYWIAKDQNQPFALIMTIQETSDSPIDELKLSILSHTGTSYCLDFMIGNKDYFGKGFGADTLSQFVDFFRGEIDRKADLFMIDPASDNPRAMHVYMKAGFKYVGDFTMTGPVSGAGKAHHLLIKKF